MNQITKMKYCLFPFDMLAKYFLSIKGIRLANISIVHFQEP